MKPGPRNSITDIDGLLVGNAQNDRLKSGVTVLTGSDPFTASVAVHGGGPGTRDTELLRPENTVTGVNALVLSGGSAFGLDAPSGVQAWMRENDRGFEVGPVRVPIVPGAILFDQINGGDKDWGTYPPYRELGYEAVESAGTDFECGTIGAGTGATVAGLKGGLGTASLVLENGVTIAALFAVNAVGSPIIGDTGHFLASTFEQGNEFGGLGMPTGKIEGINQPPVKFRGAIEAGTNTTIGIVATDAVLSKSEARRLAIAAHDGLARAIWPAHTPMDGDLVFSVATGGSGIVPDMIGHTDLAAHAVSVVSRAIARGVYEAKAATGDPLPTYSEKYPS